MFILPQDITGKDVDTGGSDDLGCYCLELNQFYKLARCHLLKPLLA